MTPIQPTPSQAAVVLKKFLAQHAVHLPLGVYQEAIARIHGHASWNALTAHQSARVAHTATSPAASPLPAAGTCRACGSHLEGDYCSSVECRYFDWPQWVLREDLTVFDVDEIEERYHVKVRQAPGGHQALRTDPDGNIEALS